MAANMCWAPSHYPESHVQSSGVTRRCTLSSKESPNQLWHSRIDEHLKEGRYSPYTTRCRIAVASRFVGYLNKEHVALEAVEPADVDHYLREELRLYRQRHQRVPRSMDHWRHRQTAGIYMLLRLVRKQWPPEVVEVTLLDRM